MSEAPLPSNAPLSPAPCTACDSSCTAAGKACATLDGRTHELGERDGLIVPAGVAFRIANAADAPFEAIVCLPVGARATVDGEVTVPPWAA